MARYFTLRFYFHSSMAHKNTLSCSWSILSYHTWLINFIVAFVVAESVNHDSAVQTFLTCEDLSAHPLQHIPVQRSCTGSTTTSGMTPTASRSLNIPIGKSSTATLPLDYLELPKAKDVPGHSSKVLIVEQWDQNDFYYLYTVFSEF